jgi:hypothetical protein
MRRAAEKRMRSEASEASEASKEPGECKKRSGQQRMQRFLVQQRVRRYYVGW